MQFNLSNSFYHEFDEGSFYASCSPEKSASPSLVYLNEPLTESLDLKTEGTQENELAEIFTGNKVPDSARPIAQAYAGHQFGQFNPQLGDGRALILGEIVDKHGLRQDLCLKGSGKTPFSRGGDGRAALGPMLREVIISEAMHSLGIPTTRSLAVVGTGDYVFRKPIQYGAILARTAESHIRIGTFQFFAARGMEKQLRQLTDYSIQRHFPELDSVNDPQEKYIGFLRKVCERQAMTVAKWMGVGFIHGVMNTDNMLISGETIDYGPCAFIDEYNPEAVFSSIDHHGRYAYQNQPKIAQWNLARLAECLIPLVDKDAERATTLATTEITYFETLYQDAWLTVFSKKLALSDVTPEKIRTELINDWLTLLEKQKIDFTNSFRLLTNYLMGYTGPLTELFPDTQALDRWLTRWQKLLAAENRDQTSIALQLKQTSPWVIPRNHLVESALQKVIPQEGIGVDLSLFEELLSITATPFNMPDFAKEPEKRAFTAPADAEFNASFKTFCGT